jgi:hypothetical protein
MHSPSFFPLRRVCKVPKSPFLVMRYGEGTAPNELRHLAKRHWCAQVNPDAKTLASAQAIQQLSLVFRDAAGEMASYNVGNFSRVSRAKEDARLHSIPFEVPTEAVRRSSPVLAAFGLTLRDLKDSDCNWLTADEVLFHADEMMAEDRAFLVWQVAGPAKTLEFSALGIGLHTSVGTAVLFDGLQPHAVRSSKNAGRPFKKNCEHIRLKEDLRARDIAVYLSMDVPLTPALCELMQIDVAQSQDELEETRLEVKEYTGDLALWKPGQ